MDIQELLKPAALHTKAQYEAWLRQRVTSLAHFRVDDRPGHVVIHVRWYWWLVGFDRLRSSTLGALQDAAAALTPVGITVTWSVGWRPLWLRKR